MTLLLNLLSHSAPALLRQSLQEEEIAIVAICVAILGIGTPTVVFQGALKWSQEHRDLAGLAFGAAMVLGVLSLLTCAAISLAVIGWLPPLDELMHGPRP